MDESMKTIIREMREERCPKHVLNEVRRSIAMTEGPAPQSLRLRLAIGTVAAVALAWALFWVFTPGPSKELATTAPKPRPSNPERTAHEAYASLASIGMALQEASTRSGTIILKQTLPLLRQGLETTKHAIKDEAKL